MQLLITLSLAAGMASTAKATIPHPLHPRQTAPPEPELDDCTKSYISLIQQAPQMESHPGLVKWFGSELSRAAVAAATASPPTGTPFNLCDDLALTSTATPPSSLSSAWSEHRSEVTSFVRAHSSAAKSLASSCEAASSSHMWGFYFGGLLVTDKPGCETLYEAYLGAVPTLPVLTGVYDDLPEETGTATGGRVVGVFTTITPGAEGPTRTGTGSGTGTTGTTGSVETQTSGNAAARETGFVAAAAVAVLGVVAAL
ncbi:hypothetical protein QBC47DRAFT_383988 [Echria macrotheca]|uniref:Infection structure specific protein n=1 Tax=Echria macrotheca TaxID=438768 RepID=A0AAJ0F8K7_9PEZI|nr:hypothetical protein QBC47DRAFT_383988 [Echria macrotheca]